MVVETYYHLAFYFYLNYMGLKKKAIAISLLFLSIIEIVIGIVFGVKISDCPTCLALSPVIYSYYAIIINLILIPIIAVFRYFVLEKDEEKAKQVLSGIIIALLVNLLTGCVAFVFGCAGAFYVLSG